MSTDASDVTPVIGPPPSVEEQARGRAAQNPPRRMPPILDSHHLDALDDSLYHAFARARDLFRIRDGRNPADDVEYPRLKPHLITLAGRWSRELQDDPVDDELAELLAELRRYLPKHDRGVTDTAGRAGIIMRARMRLQSVEPFAILARVRVNFHAIGPGDHPTDHVDLTMTVVNPSLVGKFEVGQTFDVQFTEIPPKKEM